MDSVKNIFAVPELRRRVLFTFGLLAVYRIGSKIPTPGINTVALEEIEACMQGAHHRLHLGDGRCAAPLEMRHGLALVEVQQTSDTTFRLYDYGRPRELHLERGLEVAEGIPYAAKHRRSIADGPVLVDGPYFRLDWIEGAPDEATLAAYPGALLALPLVGEIAAKDGSARAGAGECLVVEGLGSLDFSAAGVTLLTRAA